MKLTACNLIPIIRKLSDMTCKTISITPVEILLKGDLSACWALNRAFELNPVHQ